MADERPAEGIYLQTKKSTIGTGSTAKHAEFRNFWATLSIGDTHVEMILLDDAFMLTGIRERFPIGELTGANWLFVEQGAKKYGQLKPRLTGILNPQPKTAPPKGAPQGAAGKGPASPFGGKKTGQPASKKDGWWNQ